MEYSGPASVAEVEADLAMSDDDDASVHWPSLETHRHPHYSASAKRTMDRESDTGSEPASPAAKTFKRDDAPAQQPATDISLPRPHHRTPPLSATPAFAPRDEYVKLAFKQNPTTAVKLRWLNDVNTAFRLDRELAEVKMSAATSRFVYISRCRKDILDSVMGGEFSSVQLDIQDSSERTRKFPTYLITRYPVDVDPSLAKELPGVHTVRRFRQHGTPINRLVITWSLLSPPPPLYDFSFLPCLPPCEFRRMKDEQPWCFNCWGIGHISRYCSASEKCAWCAGGHASRSCPYRTSTAPAAQSATTSTAETSSTPEPDTSKWKCPRCLMPGVNVWHGCARRSRADSHHSQPQPQAPSLPPPPPPVSSPAPRTSAEIIALRNAVAALESRCAALAARFDAIDARIDSLVSQGATAATTLSGLTESHGVVIASVSALTERLDVIASRLEKFADFSPTKPSPPCTASGNASVHSPTSSASRKTRGNLR